jgi:hypothetical protein
MTVSKLLEQTKTGKVGNEPVVVVPLDVWKEVEDRLEDLEMMQSESLRKRIAKARAEKKLYSAAAVRKLLRL